MRSLELQITVVLSATPRQIDRGDVQWHYEENIEAVLVGRKRNVAALFLNYIIM